jgi:hypothetical protein
MDVHPPNIARLVLIHPQMSIFFSWMVFGEMDQDDFESV